MALAVDSDPHDIARYIFRAAAEITWDPESKRFLSPRPELGPPARHFGHVIGHVADELGYVLVITSQTQWINVPASDRMAIEALPVPPGA
jgi:hypothetical protein